MTLNNPPIMLPSLPGDLHFHILSYITDLSSLQSAILSHSTLYNTFLNYRSQIIKSIFLNQLYSWEIAFKQPGSSSDSSTRIRNASNKIISRLPSEKQVEYINDYSDYGVPKPTCNHPDAEIFYSALWPIVSKSNSPIGLRWGLELASIYFYHNKSSDALNTALKVFENIDCNEERTVIERRATKTLMVRLKLQQDCAALVTSLCRYLHEEDKAIELHKGILRVSFPHQKTTHATYSLSLSQIYESVGQSHVEALIDFQVETWELYSNQFGPKDVLALEWARYVVLTYNKHDLIQESLDFQYRVLNGLSRGSMEFISWSRGLIRHYLKVQNSRPPQPHLTSNPTEMILRLSQQAFASYPSTAAGYIGWSRDLCNLLRLQDKEEEALAVEITVWEEMRRQILANPRNKNLASRMKGPALVLVASYRRAGKLEEAAAVERECMKWSKAVSKSGLENQASSNDQVKSN